MKDRRRFYYLTGLMALLAVSITAVSTFMFYDAYFEQQRSRFIELAQSQARLIEAIGHFDIAHSQTDHLDGALGATLSQIKEAHSRFEGFGETGEFVLAHISSEKIALLSKRRHESQALVTTINHNTLIAAPMLKALKGESGSMISSDYRGISVLAAYEHVDVFNLGIVAKIDLAEIRAPFIQAGAMFSVIGIFLVFITSFLFFRIVNPLIQHLERALAALKKLFNEQESLISKRTAELNSELNMRKMIEKSLIRAKTEADEVNRSKSEFIANMSHELRTPLNSIIGFSEIIKNEMFGKIGNEKYKDYAFDINNSGAHLLSLINDILDVSKIEAGAVTLSDDIFDPRAPLNESIRMLKNRAHDAGIQITSEVLDGCPNLKADELRVKQMILNLLTNSIKFTPKGGKVQILVHGHLNSGLEIEVADNGVGIAADDLERVMQPYGQAGQDAAVRVEESTGLGLPLINMLIELHGGTMKLTSAKGEGTQIILRFPKTRVVAPRVIAD